MYLGNNDYFQPRFGFIADTLSSRVSCDPYTFVTCYSTREKRNTFDVQNATKIYHVVLHRHSYPFVRCVFFLSPC